jgi:GNAT superfamily N-acetyltransferase
VAYSRPEPLRGKHDCAGFSSGEGELDVWLERYARHAESAGSARTFVTTADGARVAGYYALAVGEVASDDATKRLLKGQPPGRSVPVVILARLAVDQNHQGTGVGTSLLQDALLRTAGIAEEVGVRALVVHAMTTTARNWYLQFGFEPSPTDPLHLVLLVKDLKKLLDEHA